jgi:hypothetical protein
VRCLDGRNVAAFLVMGENALAKMKHLVGEDLDPKEAVLKYHKSLRALYGKDPMRHGFFYSQTPECVIQVIIHLQMRLIFFKTTFDLRHMQTIQHTCFLFLF